MGLVWPYKWNLLFTFFCRLETSLTSRSWRSDLLSISSLNYIVYKSSSIYPFDSILQCIPPFDAEVLLKILVGFIFTMTWHRIYRYIMSLKALNPTISRVHCISRKQVSCAVWSVLCGNRELVCFWNCWPCFWNWEEWRSHGKFSGSVGSKLWLIALVQKISHLAS